jgi:hypothetical protein
MIKKMRLLGPGLYSVASGYECQFLGAISHFPVTQIWQAKSEAKCKFFARLFMHNRVLTADNMSKRNWTCDPSVPSVYATLKHRNTYFLNAITQKRSGI